MRRLLYAALWTTVTHAITIAPGWEQRLTNELHKIAATSRKSTTAPSASRSGARGKAAAAFGAVDPTGARRRRRLRLGQRHEVVTGASILRLVADGRLALDDAAAPYVDRFLARLGVTWTLGDLWGAQTTKTTVRDLLGMTSRYPTTTQQTLLPAHASSPTRCGICCLHEAASGPSIY